MTRGDFAGPSPVRSTDRPRTGLKSPERERHGPPGGQKVGSYHPPRRSHYGHARGLWRNLTQLTRRGVVCVSACTRRESRRTRTRDVCGCVHAQAGAGACMRVRTPRVHLHACRRASVGGRARVTRTKGPIFRTGFSRQARAGFFAARHRQPGHDFSARRDRRPGAGFSRRPTSHA